MNHDDERLVPALEHVVEGVKSGELRVSRVEWMYGTEYVLNPPTGDTRFMRDGRVTLTLKYYDPLVDELEFRDAL